MEERKMLRIKKSLTAIVLVCCILLCANACSNSNSNASDHAAEPASLDPSAQAAFMETYAPPGVVTDIKSALIGDWYYSGFYGESSFPQGLLSYEPAITFTEDGTFVSKSVSSQNQAEYRIDDSNTLFIAGQAYSYSSEVRKDTWYLENYDGLQLTFHGIKYVKDFPKGELFKKIIGTWERESEYGSYFDKITFYEDCSAVWVSYDKKEEEQHGSFAINEKEKLLYINGCAKPFFIWDLSQTSITYEYGEDMWDAGKISYYTWGFSNFGDSYNLIISGCSYKKIAD